MNNNKLFKRIKTNYNGYMYINDYYKIERNDQDGWSLIGNGRILVSTTATAKRAKEIAKNKMLANGVY